MANVKGDTAVLKQLGANLRRARVNAELTQMDVASKSKIDVATIGDIERGARNPSVTTLARLAAAVGISVEDFFRAIPAVKNGAKPAREAVKLEERFVTLEKRLSAIERRGKR